MVPKSEWEWFGFLFHYCCGYECRFHLCTKIGSIVVSTIGERCVSPMPDIDSDGYLQWKEIGCDRTYETIVFRTASYCTQEGCNCGGPVMANGSELDFAEYNNRKDATEGHMRMCEKWADLEGRE